jgi:hypothetical protein
MTVGGSCTAENPEVGQSPPARRRDHAQPGAMRARPSDHETSSAAGADSFDSTRTLLIPFGPLVLPRIAAASTGGRLPAKRCRAPARSPPTCRPRVATDPRFAVLARIERRRGRHSIASGAGHDPGLGRECATCRRRASTRRRPWRSACRLLTRAPARVLQKSGSRSQHRLYGEPARPRRGPPRASSRRVTDPSCTPTMAARLPCARTLVTGRTAHAAYGQDPATAAQPPARGAGAPCSAGASAATRPRASERRTAKS